MNTVVKKLTMAQVRKLIAKRNKEFKAATPAQQRVLVAKDVIEQIENGKFNVYAHHFFTVPQSQYDQCDEQLQTQVLSGALPECSGCALGAMLLSCTLFNDKLTLGEACTLGSGRALKSAIVDDVPIGNGLNRIFDPTTLRLIEQAFELGKGAWYVSDYDLQVQSDETKAAIAFGEKHLLAKDRLVAIMQNIVANKGTFKP